MNRTFTLRRRSRPAHAWLVIALLLLAVPLATAAQGQAAKRPLTHDDYDSWKSIRGQRISNDGRWVVYQIAPQEGDGELVVRAVRGATEYRQPRGQGALFTSDSRFVIFLVAPPDDSVKAAQKAKKKAPDQPKSALAIMDLRDGSLRTVERVKSFRIADEASGWVAYLMEGPTTEETKAAEKAKEKPAAAEEPKPEAAEEKTPEKKKDYGTKLVLQSLTSADNQSWESVLDCRFTDKGDWFFFIVSSKEQPESDGVYAVRPGTAGARPLLTGLGNYKGWTLDRSGTRLAFVTDRDDYQAEVPTFALYGWKAGDETAARWVAHTSTTGFPQGFAVSDKGCLSFTRDGSVLTFGIKEIPPAEPEKPESDETEEEQPKFELWSWNDPYPYPQQKLMANRYRDRTFDAVYHLSDGTFVQLGDELIWDVRLSDDGKVGYAQTDMPYRERVSYDSAYYDFYLVDPRTGRRTLIKQESYNGGSLSPGAKYVMWWETDHHWYVYDIAKGTTTNITKGLPVPVFRADDDTPQPKGSYGTAGWTDNDASVLIYDAFDIWEVRPDGSGARCITEGFGRRNNLQLRYRRMDPEERTINPSRPILLSATDQKTMAEGYYRDRVQGDREPQRLHMADVSYGNPTKAKNADVILTTRQTFYEFPDLWVTDPEFRNFTKLSDVGAQREAFIWGKAELVSYINKWGNEYRGILIKPEDFDPAKKYPMLVYIYETLSSGLHGFRSPGPGTSINVSYYVSNGYVVWQPDIYYGTGHPGPDALDCVVPSVQRILELGFVDPKRVGLQGHSWGGYQGAYMITQTDIFAAVESGAPVSNMTSAYGGIRWGSGMVRQFQYEHTQSRLGRNLWDGGLMRYLENSPLFYADRITTPVLILHNDNDDAVPWYQGIEFIMALRRLGKPAWMFNYNGEPHGLRKRVNQKDYTVRMQQFFDHYLKGAPMPDWMEEGIQAWKVPPGR
jgi:dipeptidyl aminopeptidase/acylaminoacyl peptidase